MKKRVLKGCYGYLAYAKKKSVLLTILYFAVSVSLYAAGIWSTGSNQNLLTIVAVLGLLPASKSLIGMIMFLKATGCSESAHSKLSSYDETLTGLYDMYFTSYQKNFAISHMVLKGNVICGYTESEKCDCKACEKHLEQMAKQDGYQNLTIKIFDRLDKYIDRLGQLEELEVEEKKEQDGILRMLCSISL